MTLMQRRFLMLGLALLLALAAAFGYWRWGRAVAVPLATVQPGSVAVQVSGPGTLQARSAVALASRLNATVTAVLADVGDTVQAGQLLVTLDGREPDARLAALRSQQQALARGIDAARAALVKAEAELALAQSRQRRDAELQAQGFVSSAGIEASITGLQVANAAVDAARATLAGRQADATTLTQETRAADVAASLTRLHAPINGLVVQRLAEPGSTVGIGAPILKLIDPATLWVATRVDESVVGRLALGQRAQVRLRSGETVAGQVARIARQSDAATRELEVFVSLDQLPAHFAIDQEAAVSIATGAEPGLVIPLAALTQDRDGRTGVLVVVDGRTAFRPVTPGGAEGAVLRVTDGLNAGEVVVADGQAAKANQSVRVLPSPSR